MQRSSADSADSVCGATTNPGLFRYEVAGHGKSVVDVFGSLLRHPRFEPIAAADRDRGLRGGRLCLDQGEGYGGWEFFLIDRNAFLVTNELVFDSHRVETVPGEGLVAFHLRMSGRLELKIPGPNGVLCLEGPRLLMWYQKPGTFVTERVNSGTRECTITLYCSVAYLRSVIVRSGGAALSLVDDIERGAERGVWYKELNVTAALTQIGSQLLQNSYAGGLRLLHAEAKALEFLCAILQICSGGGHSTAHSWTYGPLDRAREMLRAKMDASVRVCDVARSIGMSESALKRGFKQRFGVSVFDYRLDCRMRHALELLQLTRKPVGQVAYEVGYRHLSSFSAAFSEFYGYHPRLARAQAGPIILTN